MKTIELDKALRERGLKKLTEEVNAIFAPVHGQFRIGYGLSLKNADGARFYLAKPGEALPMNASPLQAHEALNMAKAAIIEHLREKREQSEVDEFIKSVDDLRGNVEQLYSELPR